MNVVDDVALLLVLILGSFQEYRESFVVVAMLDLSFLALPPLTTPSLPFFFCCAVICLCRALFSFLSFSSSSFISSFFSIIDLGQMFAYLSHTDAVKKRHSIAKTMKLVPSARPLKLWVEQNKDNPAFREKLGLR